MDILLKVKLNNPNSKEYKKRAAYLARARKYSKNYSKRNPEKIAAKNRRYRLAIKKTRNKDALLLLRQKAVFLITQRLEKRKEWRFLQSYRQELSQRRLKAAGLFNWEAKNRAAKKYREKHKELLRLKDRQRSAAKRAKEKEWRERPENKEKRRLLDQNRKEKRRIYMQRNRERFNTYSREWARKAKLNGYKPKETSHLNKRLNAYIANRKIARKEYQKKYRAKTRQKSLDYGNAYRSKPGYKEAYSAYHKNYLARKKIGILWFLWLYKNMLQLEL